jgi:hypothetical protein
MGTVEGVSYAEEETLELRFVEPVRTLFDERHNCSLGSGSVFQVTWCPHEAAIFALR